MKTRIVVALVAGCVLAGCGEGADSQVMIDDDGNMVEVEAPDDAEAPQDEGDSIWAAGGLPDGLYDCSMFTGTYLMGFGSIEISGNRFRGPGYDGKYENSWEGYTLSPDDVILWDGPLQGLDSGGSKVVSSIWEQDAPEKPYYINLTVQTPAGNYNTITCQ